MRDLRSWLDQVRQLGLLREVHGAHWDLEIGAITDLNAKANKHALLFSEIKDAPSDARLVTGSLLDSKRVALALGWSPDLSDLDLVKTFRTKLAGSSQQNSSPMEVVDEAPFLENKQQEVDLLRFPAPRWFEDDGGRYMGTADAVITRDPETDWVNVGTYRMMLQDPKTLSIFIEGPRHARVGIQKYWERGEPCPVAISLGHHPLLSMFAGVEVPPGVSEYDFAGSLTDHPYRVVKGPLTGLPIPADGEIVLEGHLVDEPRSEGPFGEFTGYYGSGTTQSPSIQIQSVYHRNQPIMLATCSGRPPHDYSYFRCPVRAALIWNILEAAGVDGVQGVWCHEAGYSRAFTVVSIKQMFGGHDRMAGYIASQCRPGAITGRYVIVVDEDIDPTDLDAVVWALCSRSDPATGFEIVTDSLGTSLDPIAEVEANKDLREYTSNRGIIFATKPLKKVLRNQFPKVVDVSPELRHKVLKGWSNLFESSH